MSITLNEVNGCSPETAALVEVSDVTIAKLASTLTVYVILSAFGLAGASQRTMADVAVTLVIVGAKTPVGAEPHVRVVDHALVTDPAAFEAVNWNWYSE